MPKSKMGLEKIDELTEWVKKRIEMNKSANEQVQEANERLANIKRYKVGLASALQSVSISIPVSADIVEGLKSWILDSQRLATQLTQAQSSCKAN